MDNPRPEGLSYDAAKRILKKNKMPSINPNARKAILNNVKLQEGKESAMALDKETRDSYKGIGGLSQFNPRFGRGCGLRIRGGLGSPKPCSLTEGFERVGPSTYKKVYK
jgi:hypothetical protein